MLNSGDKFGRLTVVRFDHRSGNKKYRYYYECECECGKHIITREDGLKSGHTKSCGCLHHDIIVQPKNLLHSKTRFYSIWRNMKSRAFNPNNPYASNYNERGISCCDEWKTFNNFYIDMYESYAKHVKEYGEKNTTLDRIDNDKGYSKENCKWATIKEQSNNKRTNHYIEYNDQVHTISEWSDILNIPYTVLYSRIKRNWSIEDAFTRPIQYKNNKEN